MFSITLHTLIILPAPVLCEYDGAVAKLRRARQMNSMITARNEDTRGDWRTRCMSDCLEPIHTAEQMLLDGQEKLHTCMRSRQQEV